MLFEAKNGKVFRGIQIDQYDYNLDIHAMLLDLFYTMKKSIFLLTVSLKKKLRLNARISIRYSKQRLTLF